MEAVQWRFVVLIPIILGVASLFLVVLGTILVIASRKPNTFQIQRSAWIKASPDKVFTLINSFYRWQEWSPWENIDSNLQRTYEGPEAGKGAIYGWAGNKNVGTGRMEILHSRPDSRIVIDLQFIKPFAAHNTAEFTLEQIDNGTQVQWTMTGANPFMMKVMGLFINMDKMIGKNFEDGLAKMKLLAEG